MADYEVFQAAHGAAALELLKDLDVLPRVIVTDLMMPVMDGHHFITRLRADPRTAGIPIVVASAYLENTTRVKRSWLPGAIMTKPYFPSALLALVKSFDESRPA